MANKNRFPVAMTTSDGRRFEKGTKVVQNMLGGEAEVIRVIDSGSVLLAVQTPNGKAFGVVSPMKELTPITSSDSGGTSNGFTTGLTLEKNGEEDNE